MTLSELDKKWNEILTLLGSDDPEEKMTGEMLETQFYIDNPEQALNIGPQSKNPELSIVLSQEVTKNAKREGKT